MQKISIIFSEIWPPLKHHLVSSKQCISVVEVFIGLSDVVNIHVSWSSPCNLKVLVSYPDRCDHSHLPLQNVNLNVVYQFHLQISKSGKKFYFCNELTWGLFNWRTSALWGFFYCVNACSAEYQAISVCDNEEGKKLVFHDAFRSSINHQTLPINLKWREYLTNYY